MRPPVQMLVGMTAAGLTAGPHRPLALLVGAVAGVLPDAIDRWVRQVFRQPDVVLTPDPLAPDACLLAAGVHAALRHAWEQRRRCLLRLNPLPLPGGGHETYLLDMDREHRVTLVIGERLARLDAMPAPLSPLHAVPLRVTDSPRDVLLTPIGGRIASRDLDRVAGGGHTCVPVVLCAALLGALAGTWMAVAAIAAGTVHMLLDFGGRRELAPWRPFSRRSVRGRRLWDETRRAPNVVAALVAIGLMMCVLLGA